MGKSNSVSGPPQIEFKEQFGELGPLIQEEWPSIDAASLEETEGDLDRVVALVSAKTDHTKTLVKKQLAELHEMANESPAPSPTAKASEALSEVLGGQEKVKKVLDDVQARTQDMIEYVRGQLVTDAKGKVASNLVMSLLMAMGLGVVLGFLLRGIGRERR